MTSFFGDWLAVMVAAMVSGTLMAGGITLLFRFLPRGFTELRAWLWWLVGVKFLLGLFLTVPVPLPVPATPVLPTVLPTSVTGAMTAPNPATVPQARVVPLSSAPIAGMLFLIWATGVVAYAVVFLRQVVAVRRILRGAESLDETPTGATVRRLAAKAGMNRPPRLVVSDAVSTPMTTNPFRPVIVLPLALLETLSDAELEMTLAHELAHIQRGDLLLAIPLTLTQAAFWFFPPVWFVARAWDNRPRSRL
jgi:beta-lactamase regulating signal transducer with metallopeptidase domain